jgi:GGDEF domain-containing protein
LALEEMHRRVEQGRSAGQNAEAATAATPTDTTTGLPPRSEAENALGRASQREGPRLTAILTVDRMQTVNAAFGVEVGDQLLTYFAGFVRRSLPPEDEVYRWSGPTLIVILSRQNGIDRAREDIGRLMAHKLEFTVYASNRKLLLPVNTRWTIIPAMASQRLLVQKIDAFTAMPGSPD